MQIHDAAAVARALPAGALVEALERMFREGCTAPVRHRHGIPVPGAPEASLLLMPAWQAGRYVGTKLVTVFPGNRARGLAAVGATYVLMDGATGAVLALIDGEELTARRTAATSALAARFLARDDADTLLVVGTGRIAAALARTHAAVHPGFRQIEVWGRNPAHAAQLASSLRAEGLPAGPVTDLETAARRADVITTATLSETPLIRGDWVRAGTHVDLVGGFTPRMREADDDLIARARVCADTREGALAEAGDLVGPIAAGRLDASSVDDLAALCRGTAHGRRAGKDITVFKSVGAALEDLAAAILVHEASTAARAPMVP